MYSIIRPAPRKTPLIYTFESGTMKEGLAYNTIFLSNNQL